MRFSCAIEAIAGFQPAPMLLTFRLPIQRCALGAIGLNAFRSHRNLKLGLGDSLIYPRARSHVTVIPTDGDSHVVCTGNLVVCGVKSNPVQPGQAALNLSMGCGSQNGSAVRVGHIQIAGNLPCRDAPLACHRDHHMSIVLANSLARFEQVLKWRSRRCTAWSELEAIVQGAGETLQCAERVSLRMGNSTLIQKFSQSWRWSSKCARIDKVPIGRRFLPRTDFAPAVQA